MADGHIGQTGLLVTNHATLAFTEDGDTATILLLYMAAVLVLEGLKKNTHAIHMHVQVS